MRGRRQPQRIPPPIDHGSERIDAEPVLLEYPGEMGVALWKTARAVRLWTQVQPDLRATAFRPDAYERRMALVERVVTDAELRAELEIAAGVLRGEDVLPDQVADACARISDWALAVSCTGTAIQFIQAAAFMRPTDASLAYRTARVAAIRTEHARAETWCRHTMVVARASRDWHYFVFALLVLGNLSQLRGNLPMGRRLAQRAVRVAKRHSLRETLGYAYTSLVGLTPYSKPREVERYARGALETFSPGHPWLHATAHNLAIQWMDAGFFEAALTVFRGIPRDFGRMDEHLGIAANLARAAAAVGDMESYLEARARCERLLEHPATRQSAASSLVNLGRAALLAGDWDYAEACAARAGRLARELGHGREVLSAEALSDSVQAERLAGSVPRPDILAAPPAVAQLAADVVAALEPAGAGGP
jgi:hypothetical protein